MAGPGLACQSPKELSFLPPPSWGKQEHMSVSRMTGKWKVRAFEDLEHRTLGDLVSSTGGKASGIGFVLYSDSGVRDFGNSS